MGGIQATQAPTGEKPEDFKKKPGKKPGKKPTDVVSNQALREAEKKYMADWEKNHIQRLRDIIDGRANWPGITRIEPRKPKNETEDLHSGELILMDADSVLDICRNNDGYGHHPQVLETAYTGNSWKDLRDTKGQPDATETSIQAIQQMIVHDDSDYRICLRSGVYSTGNLLDQKALYIGKPSVKLPQNWFQPNKFLDVFYPKCLGSIIPKETHLEIQKRLRALSESTSDYFGLQYQNLIDPNLQTYPAPAETYPHAGLPENYEFPWMCTECKVDQKLKATIEGPIHRFTRQAEKPFFRALDTLLSAAMPPLHAMYNPKLLLPGKLQVVVKAQRIIVNPGEDYEGVWHKEQRYESVVAVVLYYYDYGRPVGPHDKKHVGKLQGGDLEFLSRSANTLEDIWDGKFEETRKRLLEKRVRVPLDEGKMVVFSNYQNVHRVLRCRNSGKVPLSRDFVIFYIIDQGLPLPSFTVYQSTVSTLRTTLKASMANKTKSKTATSDNVPSNVVDIVLEYASYLNNPAEQFKIRRQLMLDHLEPCGTFGLTSERCYTTGNGDPYLMGWLNNVRNGIGLADWYEEDEGEVLQDFQKLTRQANRTPDLGRGLSATGDDKLCKMSKSLSSSQEAAVQEFLDKEFKELARGGEKILLTTLKRVTEHRVKIIRGISKVSLGDVFKDAEKTPPLDLKEFKEFVFGKLVPIIEASARENGHGDRIDEQLAILAFLKAHDLKVEIDPSPSGS